MVEQKDQRVRWIDKCRRLRGPAVVLVVTIHTRVRAVPQTASSMFAPAGRGVSRCLAPRNLGSLKRSPATIDTALRLIDQVAALRRRTSAHRRTEAARSWRARRQRRARKL